MDGVSEWFLLAQTDIMPNIAGLGWGGGVVAVFVLLYKLLFARERSEYIRLQTRIETVERELKEEREARLECIRNLGITEGRIRQMSEDFDKVIRRHDDKTREQIQKNIEGVEEQYKQEIEKLKQQLREAKDLLGPPPPVEV